MKYFSTLDILIVIAGLAITIAGIVWNFLELQGAPALAVGFSTLIYAALSAKLNIHFNQEEDFFSKFSVLHTLSNTKIDQLRLETIEKFNSISNPYLEEIKLERWSEFENSVTSLSVNKRSKTVSTALYSELINRAVKSAKKGDNIKAISLLLPGEFDDTQGEKKFHQAQIDAEKRGVNIERYFYCTQAQISNFQKTGYWESHCNLLNGQFCDSEKFKLKNSSIEGFIMFNNIVFIDRKNDPNCLEGIVSASDDERKKILLKFKSLEPQAIPLDEL